uniref:NADH-ubiquinone oxidoreductase chain 4L n=1 Tax=Scarabaeidae sp. BMNH 1274752 TaxID=1796540 RepID=A0A126TGK2_9SCAR|nr:NADH dehydrogenase subunit 4L [Scarabaeidae sp. BMNH 1274752]
MLMFCLIFSIIMYFSGLFSFTIKRKHFLVMLLSLEFIVLSLYFNIFLYLSYFKFEFFFGMVFLTMSVCEGSLGLSIMVSMVRSYGNDYFQTFNMLW